MNAKTKVLVVEDDGHLLSGIRDILELEDYAVSTATNGVDGLSCLQADPENPPDIIVSDIMMPRMNGFEFLEEVRKVDEWVKVPFIFLTAKGEKADVHRGRRLGADVYLTKPFDAEDLLVAIESSLKRLRHIADVNHAQVAGVKRKIMTMLNHEMRTPLTLVVAYADMVKEYDPQTMNENEVMTFLKGVNSGADRLRRLIENFIVLVELESGDAEKTFAWRKRPIQDVSLMVEDAIRQVSLADQRPRNFIANLDPELPPLVADVQFLTIILRELLDNAAKFSDDYQRVELNVCCAGDVMEFRVTDEGRGIMPSVLDQIWEPFYQYKREQYEDQGAGSGLAIVAGLVELHGGTCHVESAPGEGSTFTVRLPLKPVETPAL